MLLDGYMPMIEDLVERALDEDLAGGDITTGPLIPPHTRGKASFMIKAQGILAGIDIAKLVFMKIDPFLKFSTLIHDGNKVKTGDIVATVEGDVPGILKGERTALNFLQHLSGIATQTALYVKETEGLPVKILGF